MLKRFKLSHMLAVASLLLAIVGFGFSNKAIGQEACPFIENETGWLRLDVTTSSNFTAGLLGTVEDFNGQIVGGIDWLYKNDNFETFFVLPTDTTGGQLISWWTQKDGRNTYLQVTNDGFFDGCFYRFGFCRYSRSDTR
ncbi:MAG: hypothetical protein KatS3mg078_1521 [Deltaproteobacteria bacterium]|nr:MAG: hypothetical protein KatS3mg078_1521 [Deltaproteobacteria bacterium]